MSQIIQIGERWDTVRPDARPMLVTMGSEIQWPIVASNDTLCSRQDWTRSTSLPWNSSICSMRNTSLYVSFLVWNTPLFQWGINRRHPAFIRRTIIPMKSFLLGSVWSRLPHGSSILSSLQQGKRRDLISKAECKAKKHQKASKRCSAVMSTHIHTCRHMSTHVHSKSQNVAKICRQEAPLENWLDPIFRKLLLVLWLAELLSFGSSSNFHASRVLRVDHVHPWSQLKWLHIAHQISRPCVNAASVIHSRCGSRCGWSK